MAVFNLIDHGRRVLHWSRATYNPTAEWVAQQLRNAFMDLEDPTRGHRHGQGQHFLADRQADALRTGHQDDPDWLQVSVAERGRGALPPHPWPTNCCVMSSRSMTAI